MVGEFGSSGKAEGKLQGGKESCFSPIRQTGHRHWAYSTLLLFSDTISTSRTTLRQRPTWKQSTAGIKIDIPLYLRNSQV